MHTLLKDRFLSKNPSDKSLNWWWTNWIFVLKFKDNFEPRMCQIFEILGLFAVNLGTKFQINYFSSFTLIWIFGRKRIIWHTVLEKKMQHLCQSKGFQTFPSYSSPTSLFMRYFRTSIKWSRKRGFLQLFCKNGSSFWKEAS